MSMKDLVRAPPVCLPTRGDQETIEILEKFGKALLRPEDEVAQAQNLAAGFSDIVVLLERPRHRRDHKFDVSFEDFVKSCKTLLALDELIRFATKGARSIYTVTVLDAFSYQPDKYATEQDKQCHEVLAQILRAKKPKVILRCHRGAYCDEWLKQVELPGENYRLGRKEICIVNDHTTVVLQSFHPSCAVNNADCRPEYRALLMYHFVAAFLELTSQFALPETAEEIRKLCLKSGERRPEDIRKYKPWEAATLISRVLEIPYQGPGMQFIGFADEAPSESRSTQVRAFRALYGSLQQLFGNTNSFGGLAIAKIVLFLWKQHFQKDPLYDHVMSWLVIRGNQQKNWFACETRLIPDQRTVEEQLSALELSTPSITRNIRSIIDEVLPLLCRASATLVRGEHLADDCRAQIIDTYEKHNELVRRHLGELSMSDINYAMHIRTLLASCETFLSAFNEGTYGQRRRDYVDAMLCLKELAEVIDSTLLK
ncbi:hypothetical protein KXV70_004883 [Aspergillus fumigatus]|nr:hypothetical protein KXX64_006753 [Aspergillus fumigatus]KAH2301909.1 hypothetical protein KXV47_001690 [Aspergillus fumigatus]KAH2362907.1 hypothetical protein KXV98_004554 [Aspergillus fumigatus]KAH2568130.1 hypothetical protein KXV70_004883 [Aspergillus fumigatus]KAH2884877.1 hypothetical protein KXV75_006467 [Aspergillus fumigatus]